MSGSRHIWSPRAVPATQMPDQWRRTEVDAIVRALQVSGPLPLPALRAAVDARLWGPGRFRAALGDARRQGRVRRLDRRRWAAV